MQSEDPQSNKPLSPVEQILDGIGSAISWVWLLLIFVILCAVVLRYVFGIGRIELEELQWHLYATGFLSGIVASAVHDRHVRVDVLRERMSQRLRDWIDFYGVLLFQIPLVILVIWSAVPLAIESFSTGEESSSAGGLSARWILKSVLPIAFVGLGFASVFRLRALAARLFSASAGASSQGTRVPNSQTQDTHTHPLGTQNTRTQSPVPE